MTLPSTNAVVTIGILVVIVLATLWDLYVLEGQDGVTISAALLATARRHPILPFLAGLLAGHLVWPQ